MDGGGALGGDLFGRPGQAEGYARYRPLYPEALLARVRPRPAAGPAAPGPAKGSALAVDACCGTGQLSAALAPCFDRVIGIDTSAEQLRHASTSSSNVEYRVGDASCLEGIGSDTADLVTIGQALHWLDAAAFCLAAHRVLRPGGCLAILGYGICSLGNAAAEEAFKEYYYNTLGSTLPLGSPRNYWDCDRKMLDEGFADKSFPPFQDVERHWHCDEKSMDVEDFMSYLDTMSAYRTYLAREELDPLPKLRERLIGAVGDEGGRTLGVRFPYFLILCRKPAAAHPAPSLVAAFGAGRGAACEDCVAFSRKHYPDGLNANFLRGDHAGIVADHVKKFEDPEKRDLARAAPEIVEMLVTVVGLGPRSVVADIGAGTGLLLSRLSAVASSVLATEISSAFQAYLRKQVGVQRLPNVKVIASTPDDPCLPEQSVDVALVCDVYHHFEYPVTTCRRVREALRPGGRFIVIDFIRDDAVHKSHAPGWVLEHVRAGQDVFREEIESAGFDLVAEPRIAGLEENYCMVFAPRGGGPPA